MTIKLFYHVAGILKTFPDVEETKQINNIDDLNETLKNVFSACKEPYKYEFRIDVNEKSWFFRRNGEDVKNGVYNMTYSPDWNIHEADEKITARAIKKLFTEFFSE